MKALKIAGYSIAALLALLIVAAITLSLVFDPNQYKPEIIKLVKDQTGRDLRIEKKIGWSFFPRLGIEAGGVELSNAPGFGKEPFARIDAAGVHVAVLPLFTGRVEIGSLYLHGLNLNLAKDAGGRSNWDDLMAKKEARATAPEPKPEKKSGGKLPLEGLAVGKLDIQRATIIWRDAGNVMAVKNLNLATSRFVAGEPMDMKLGFELDRTNAAPIKAALTSRLTATSDALKLANVDLRVDDSRLTGNIDVHNFASPALRFDLALDKIDLDRYLGAGSAGDKKEAKTKTATSEKPTEIPLSTLRGLNVDGKFRIDQLKAFGLKSSEAKIALTARNGLITLGPNSAKLYGGSYNGQTQIDARGQTLQLGFNEKLQQVQVGPLLKDMQLFDNYTGTGDITANLTAAGLGAQQIRRSLNGKASVAFRDGKIEGVDLLKLIEQGRALYNTVKGKPVTVNAKQGDTTPFRSLTANLLVTNGVARNDDLVIDGTNLRGTGRGSADLVRETLDYKLRVTVAEAADKRGTTVPVLIGGTFAKPTYNLDFGELLKKEAEKQLEKGLEKGLQDLLAPKKKKR